MSYIERELETAIKEQEKHFPVITITGPRQSGKTTLIRHLFSDMPYYTLEDLDTRALALTDPRGFLANSDRGMVLDEVQNGPQLMSYIQGIVDRDPEKKFILSGSSQFSMMKSITQSLAGRTAVFELMPMAYSEVKIEAQEKSLDQMLFDGFYPAIYSGMNNPEFFYPNYVKTYLERDVRDLLAIKDLVQFQTFLRLCAGRIGSLFNANELAGETGVSYNTVKSWLSVLQASYIIYTLHPYYDNIGKRLVKTPKLYFTDTGLACWLLGIESAEDLSKDRMREHLFENFVVTEALKQRLNKGKESNLFFYRDSNHNEVDLLAMEGSTFTAIEIKSSQTFNPDFQKGIRSFAEIYGDRVKRKIVVYNGDLESKGEYELVNYRDLFCKH